MKAIMTCGNIISLENVRSVRTTPIAESKHTTKGRPYYLYHASIIIDYFGNEVERIDFKDYESEKTLEQRLTSMMNEIFEEIKK